MDRLLEDIVEIIKDYRNDDGIQITTETLRNWILQFDVNDQIFILEELKPILDKRYISKSSYPMLHSYNSSKLHRES